MEQNFSEAGSPSWQKLRLFLDEVSIWEGLVSIFLQGFLGCLFQDGIGRKDVSIQIHSDCFDDAYTNIMFRLHKFHSQLQCTIELNKKKMYIKWKQTIYDMHHNETNVKRNWD